MPADNHSAETASPKRDDDSPWKEALERFFPDRRFEAVADALLGREQAAA